MEDRYAVRKSWDDEKSQMGLYHFLENAIKQASDFGLRVYDLETEKLIYEPSASRKEQFVANLKYMDKVMKQDIKDGHQWVYSNNARKIPKGKDFEDTRKKGYYAVNCCDGVHWAMKMMNVYCCGWYGAIGGRIQWCAKNAERDTRKYFDIIETDCSHTVKQLVANGTIQPGDILTYVSMNHTNAYIGGGKSFDSGHAHCTRGGEGAPFTRFVGSLTCGGHKVGCILRWKEAPMKYMRVQVGVYSKKATLEESKKLLKDAGFDTFQEKTDGGTRLFCGSFETVPKAMERLEQVQAVDKRFERAYLRGV